MRRLLPFPGVESGTPTDWPRFATDHSGEFEKVRKPAYRVVLREMWSG